jgi:hypothetical protein
MKTLEILLRLIDNLLTAIKFKKAQNDRDKLEANPADFFIEHFNGGLSDTNSQTDKASSPNNSAD